MFYVLNESRNDKANTIPVGRMMKKIGVQESGRSGILAWTVNTLRKYVIGESEHQMRLT